MKKTTLLLTTMLLFALSWQVNAQTICTQNFTGSGQDDDPTVVTVNAADITCNAGETINSITLVNSADTLISGDCAADGTGWYNFTLNVDGTDVITGCGSDFDGYVVPTSFSTLSITSTDSDAYSDSVTITFDLEINHVTPSCLPPTALNATNITTASAYLNWTAASGAVNYNWEVQPQGTAQGTAGAVASGSVAGTTINTGATLSANTSYDFFVQTNCGGSGTSTWAGPVSFTTPCNAIVTYPFIENFEGTVPPVCWSELRTPSSSYGWASNANGFTGKCARFDSYLNSNGNISDLTTQTFDLTSLTFPQLIFQYKNPTGGDFTVSISTDGGSSYSVLESNLTSQSSWLEKTYDISAFTGSNVVISFKGTSNYGNGDAYVYLDNITVRETPSCAAPTALTVTNKLADAADLGWTDINTTAPTNGWEYEIVDVTAGNSPTGSGTITTTNPVHVTGLTVDNTYLFLVRALCDAGNSSAWSVTHTWVQTEVPGCASNPSPANTATDVPVGTVTFTWDAPTTGGTATSYDLYGGSTNALEYGLIGTYTTPTANLNINGFNTTLFWKIVPKNAGGDAIGCPIWSFTTAGPHTDGCSGYTSDPNPDLAIPDNNATGVSDIITVAGTAPNVLDDLNVNIYADHTYLGDLTITLTSPTGTSVVLMTGSCGTDETLDVVFDDEGDAFTCGTPTSGVYIPANALSAFNGETFDGDWTLKIVDGGANDTGTLNKWCLVPTLVSCPTPIALAASNETSVGADLDWTEVGGASTWDLEIGATGFTPTGNATDDNVSKPFTWAAGTETTTYDYYVRADCSGDDTDTSMWAGPFSFTTLANCLAPTALTAANIMDTSVDLSWTENNGSSTWNVEVVAQGAAATGTPTDSNITVIPFTKSGLTANTAYDYYVQTDCGGGSTSPWAGPFTFLTDQPGNTCANPIVINALPYNTTDNTSNYYDDYSGSPGSSNCTTTSNYLNGDDVVYSYTATSNNILNFALSNISDNYSGMFIYTDCADIGTGCANGHASGFSTTDFSIDISGTNGTTYYVVISTWATPQSIAYTLDVTEITCPDPTGVTTSNITNSGADVAWTETGSTSTWDLYFAVAGGTAPDSATTPTVDNATTNPYTWTGGNPSTDYEVWVRSDCGAGDTSNWVGIGTFTTFSNDAVDYNNLQYPAAITMTYGDATGTPNGSIVYAQVYEPGVTDAAGQGTGISAWIGYGPTGSTPDDSWTWIAATYNTDVGNNDEYKMDFATNTPTLGTYDYASRFKLNNGIYTYGGYTSSGGGTWDGTTNVSGVLTVNPVVGDLCTNAIPLTLGVVFDDNDIVGTNVNATASGEAPSPSCASFGSGKDTWFSVVVPASGTVTIEVAGNGGLTDTGMSVYEGTCGALTQISCNDDIDGSNNRFSIGDFTGRTPGETLYARVWDYANNDTGTFLVSAYTKCSGATLTWDINNLEFTNGGIPATPNINTPVIFPDSTFNSTGGDIGNIEVCSCQIDSNAWVEVDNGGFIKVANDIINNGVLIVNSGGSLVQVNDDATVIGATVNFDVEVKTSLMDDPRYSYFSSPTQGSTLNIFNSWAQMNRNFTWDGATTQDWIAASATDVMNAGQGYIVRPSGTAPYPTAQSFTTNFDGAFNNGVITQPLYFDVTTAVDLADNDNALVGNPYPSGIDTAALLALNPNANSFYFWAHSTGGNWSNEGYKTWNSSGTTNGAPANIAVGQGFFVTAGVANPGNFTFNNSVRSTNVDAFLRPADNNLDKVWLNLTNTNNTIGNQILVAFNPICTDGFDLQYDATNFSTAPLAFASKGTDAQTQNLVIQTRGLLTTDDTAIPLRIEVNDDAILNNLVISIDHFENLENSNIYIRDLDNNILHDLKQGNFNFSLAQIGMNDTRFELVFSRNALSVNDNVLTNDDLIIANQDTNNFKVKMANGATITNFKAFDIVGKLIIDMDANSSNFTVNNNLKQGTVLFVKATLENGQVLSKKFIKL